LIELEYRRDERDRWRVLSYAVDSNHCTAQIVAWTRLTQGGSFRYQEADMPLDLAASLAKLKSKQDIKEAKSNAIQAGLFLDDLEQKAVLIWINDEGNLGVKGTLTTEQREKIKALKPDIIALLRSQPQWDEAEANQWETKIKDAEQMVHHLLYPPVGSPNDDIFADLARGIFIDWFAAFQLSKQCRRLAMVRQRADGILGWLANLDDRIHEKRAPRNNYMIHKTND